MTLPFHTLANLFPLIEGGEFDALTADVAANGVLDPIITLDGAILDGRNRYRAAMAAGLIPENIGEEGDDGDWVGRVRFIAFEEPHFQSEVIARGPLSWVLSKNLNRRHLNESQRAIVAAKVSSLHQGERRQVAAPEEPGALLLSMEDGAAETKPANLPVSPKLTQAEAAAAVNVSERSVRSGKKVLDNATPALLAAVESGALAVSSAEKALDLSEAEQNEVARLAGEGKANPAKTVLKNGLRADKERRLGAKQHALPGTTFGVIYADPEWQEEVYSRETGLDRAPDNHYPTSTTEEIMARDVPSIAAPDCVLWLWVPVHFLADGLKVMGAWGFEYKSHLVWNKIRNGAARGMGRWITAEHELLLIGTRGKIPCPSPGTQTRSVIDAPVGPHSEKPEVFAKIIESYFPSLPKIEMNARRKRVGWTVWGNEAPADGDEEELQSDDGQLDLETLARQPEPAPAGELTQEARKALVAALDTAEWVLDEAERLKARVAAVTNAHGLVEVDVAFNVHPDLISLRELEKAEAFALLRRNLRAEADRKGPAASRIPADLMQPVPPVAAPVAAPQPTPRRSFLSGFLNRTPKAGGG